MITPFSHLPVISSSWSTKIARYWGERRAVLSSMVRVKHSSFVHGCLLVLYFPVVDNYKRADYQLLAGVNHYLPGGSKFPRTIGSCRLAVQSHVVAILIVSPTSLEFLPVCVILIIS
ncbi:hypothetical protein GALMADRAFT_594860 [Galerina marginata CBS 339.88]|uniref:Uncharacterized protein n=1 Tax=Galerina marginata (strain CBS 339.88) TaxID=685588 RepID=A0A067SV96_GALM3|nr:hypothetical protein GALMADRAFT_594860 [Galerina marginata CBS 339.88]